MLLSERNLQLEAMSLRGIKSSKKEKTFQKKRSQKIKSRLKIIKVSAIKISVLNSSVFRGGPQKRSLIDSVLLYRRIIFGIQCYCISINIIIS